MTLCVVTLLPAAAAQPRQVLDTVTVHDGIVLENP